MKKLCSLLMILLLLTSMSASAQTIRDVVYEGVRYVFGIGERVEEVIPQLPDASGAQEQIAALEAERDALKVQLAKTEQELATAQTALTETEALLASTQTALTATEEALLSTEANLGETQAALAAAGANIADLTMQLEAEPTCPPDIAALEGQWESIRSKNQKLLEGYNPYFSIDTVAEGGVPELFRLRVGPVKDVKTGDDICAKLSKKGITCSVIRTQ